ncbi:LTA synthase family protein [Priestia flexa]|uniref:LTA synthase family protein n=1 Tax=Priestia flexa TaxID=86664 RepID=UPI00240D703F|nr:LTA synthase family protein [Priestia flexa]WEZ07443.1 LTA synthase family protein [Priestia flexa]
MKQLMTNGKNIFVKQLPLFLVAVLLFWIKTYAVYQIEFNLSLENFIQKFLLFMNPLGSAIIFFAFALLFKGRGKVRALLGINFLLSFILYANVVYYRFFNDFITVPVLTQSNNFGQLGGSAMALIQPTDILYFIDFFVLIALVMWKKFDLPTTISKRTVTSVFLVGVLVVSANIAIAETDRPQLLTRTFDRNYLVKYLGAYNYTVYDIIQSSKSSAQRALADSSDVTEVENYAKATYAEPNEEYFGKAKDMNVIYISLESLQTFMMGYELNGEEVTPFMNSLRNDKNTLYFDNVFHQTGQGKTSDAEFMVENSIFPLPQGSVFTTKANNTYQAGSAILGQNGYTNAVFHGNGKTFWNRDEMYKSFGVDKFFDSAYYDMNEEDTLNYGLEDKPFFKDSMPYLKELKQPFSAKFITLSNHFPYPLDEEDQTIEPHTTGDKSVDQYFQTSRYLDEALKQFFDDLKASGLYDNTMVVMYGDHYGISENHKRAMAEVLGKDVGDFEQAQLQRVPLFIHAPGLEGGVKHTYGGQVDIRPTVMHLLGIDTKDYIDFGTDLLSKDHQEIVPFRNGDFVTPEITKVDQKVFNNETGEQLSEEEAKKYDKYDELVKQKLELSDKLVYGDLLRFHTPEGFKPVDRSQYDYNKRD